MRKPLWLLELESTFISLKVHGVKKTIADIIFDIKYKTYK